MSFPLSPGALGMLLVTWRMRVLLAMQTHTGDYNGAGYPFHCQPIGNDTQAVKLDLNGSLSTDDPDLKVQENSILSP